MEVIDYSKSIKCMRHIFEGAGPKEVDQGKKLVNYGS
jgi:hypothetical protein